MNFNIQYIGDQINGIPHGPGTLLSSISIFTGVWEKGLRINTGTFDCFTFIIKVKFKQGKIYKFLETTLIQKPGFILRLPQINYIKEGEFFKEIPNENFVFIHKEDGIYLFDNMFTPSQHRKSLHFDGNVLYYISDKTFKIKEFRTKTYRFVGKFFNTIAHGPAKLFLMNDIYIKGFFAGFFHGPCKISQGNLKLFFEGCYSLFPNIFRVKSEEMGVDIKGYNKNNHVCLELDKNSKQYFSIITNFIDDAFYQYSRFSNDIYFQFFLNSALSFSMLERKNWFEFEKDLFGSIKNEQSKSNFEKFSGIDEKVYRTIKRIRYNDGSFYYGEVMNGLKHGIGCLIFDNSTRFKGYFKNDQISGFGEFYGDEFKIKGIWRENKLEKVIHFYRLKLEV